MNITQHELSKESEAQAKLLIEFCDAAFRTDAGQPIPVLSIPPMMMGHPVFTPCLVHKELSTLETSKSPGPDQLHPKWLKWLATFLAGPLTDAVSQRQEWGTSGVSHRTTSILVVYNDLPSVISVIRLPFADDVKIAWNWSVNWDLPINPTK